MVKIIDIDLERRRISLSLKQANEGVDVAADDFDPSLYGMTASYDDQGNYIYPEGFDPETQEWKPGYEEQQRAWEQQYAEAPRSRRSPRPTPRLLVAATRRPTRPRPVPRRPRTVAPRVRRPPLLRAPSPPTRRSPHCARSSPVTDVTGIPDRMP
jgi:hypothetical protein